MDNIFDRLHKLHPKIIDLKLERVERLLKKLGNPEKSLPSIIHVAGTNGKGSTIAMIRAALESKGYLVHVYTSPHLVNFTERIHVAGKEISKNYLKDLLLECENKNNSLPITFFEITTCAAFLAFSRSKADFTLLEVGLGGEFDATNVIKNPILSIITPISIDHKEFLGETIEKITESKAGIIKKNSTTIIGKQVPKVESILKLRCQKIGSELVSAGENIYFSKKDRKIIVERNGSRFEFPMPTLIGVHQITNAMTAILALLKLQIPKKNICAGMKYAEWPARLEKINHGKLEKIVSNYNCSNELWLDGGHNVDASKALKASIQAMKPMELHVIYGSLKNKDYKNFLINFKELSNSLWAIKIINQPNSLSANIIIREAEKIGYKKPQKIKNIIEGIDQICSQTNSCKTPIRILICGSLYLAGEVLRENGNN